jgi:hypothetical protein
MKAAPRGGFAQGDGASFRKQCPCHSTDQRRPMCHDCPKNPQSATVATDSVGVCVRSVFKRPLAGVRNPNTNKLNVPVTHSHGLAMPRSEPAPDEIGKYTNGEPVIEQSRSGAASLPCRGKQLECAPLARVELAFFMQSAHRIALRRDPASIRQMIRVSCNVQGRIGILRSLGKRSVPGASR